MLLRKKKVQIQNNDGIIGPIALSVLVKDIVYYS